MEVFINAGVGVVYRGIKEYKTISRYHMPLSSQHTHTPYLFFKIIPKSYAGEITS